MSLKQRMFKERFMEVLLMLCATVSIVTTLGILFVLLKDSIGFFSKVSLLEFLTDTQWTPLFEDAHFGILPLLSGTFLITFIAILIALPLGMSIAIYLSEYADRRVKKIIKPFLEILSSIPTVVFGYFALVFVTPLLQSFIPGLAGFNSLSPGIVMGIMILPMVASLSEDALNAVPDSLREGSYALGSSQVQTAFRVVVPAASSGITVSVILAISRAIGETMIVAIAAGQQPRLTLNPLVPIETITAYIVQVSKGDVPQDSLGYQTIFAAGLTLFVLTFLLNSVSFYFNKKFRAQYQ
ncbi:MAG TPA: phosphate ABC transporter permease subunit PstC [Cyclobacteriaceae bacterium]|jgi:phosphate transport system permease protein|nr:phosphate ABC transporter permease subunit PstC [Cyclobacteriaceae bacterium]